MKMYKDQNGELVRCFSSTERVRSHQGAGDMDGFGVFTEEGYEVITLNGYPYVRETGQKLSPVAEDGC